MSEGFTFATWIALEMRSYSALSERERKVSEEEEGEREGEGGG